MDLTTVANHILNLKLEHPVRVGIDGITASGKSTFAKQLSDILRTSGREIIQTTLDGFHNPRERRYARGRGSAEGYYFDAYNYAGMIESLLAPLGPGGNRNYKTQIFDLVLDCPIEVESKLATANAILVVDGSFALREELRKYWDVGIYLDVDRAIAEERAAIRDAESFGSADEARRVTRTRYHGAHSIHSELAKPIQTAEFVIRNEGGDYARAYQ